MAQKSATGLDKFSTPLGVRWNLKTNEDGTLEWYADTKSGAIASDNKEKRKRGKVGEVRHAAVSKRNDRVASNTTNRQRTTAAAPPTQFRGRHGNRHGSPGRQKNKGSKNSTVMLDDIKAVAYDQLIEQMQKPIAPDFDSIIFKAKQFDDFLYNMLFYYDCFFKKQDLEIKGKNSTSIEPGQTERKLFADACAKVEIARKRLGRSYCHLVMGVGLDDAHHMGCGSKRVSNTYRDRDLYETLYTYCCFAVWITFRRKHFDVIKKEMGTTLRSDTFNPAIRVKNAPDNDEDEKTDVNNPKKKVSPAEYRRIHPKRPAIKSIINQRSPAVVSILPSSREESSHLFKHQRPPSPSSILASAGSTLNNDTALNQLSDEIDRIDQEIQSKSIRIGILHDSMENYNPVSLQGGGQDAENNAEEEGGEEGAKKEDGAGADNGDPLSKLPADGGISRAPTGMSHATTDAPSEI